MYQLFGFRHLPDYFLVRIVQLFGYCVSLNYLATSHRPTTWLLCIEQLFVSWQLTNYLATAR